MLYKLTSKTQKRVKPVFCFVCDFQKKSEKLPKTGINLIYKRGTSQYGTNTKLQEDKFARGDKIARRQFCTTDQFCTSYSFARVTEGLFCKRVN